MSNVFNGTGSATNPGGPDPGSSTSDSCVPQPDDTGCVGAAYEGESIPLDIMVMFDLSCSMSCTVDQSGCCLPQNEKTPNTWRLQPVRSAMKTFLQDPASAGIGVGLQFFGNHALDANKDPVVCSVDHYSGAVVEIAPLPDNAAAVEAALDAAMPEGGTPTQLAIDGACVHIANWKAANPSHKVVILLVTDGIPEYSCNATIQNAVASATKCYNGGQGFETYVLGVSSNNNGTGSSLTQLDRIAAAGGTDHSYLTNTSDAEASVLAALNNIRADAVIPCELNIPSPPPGETLDSSKINIGICAAGSQPLVTPYVADVANCANGTAGWYYDDPNSPGMIHLCEATCSTVKAPGSTLFFSVGCATQDSTVLQ